MSGAYWLCIDPGETTGWSLWDQEGDLVWADQTPMAKFGDLLWETMNREGNENDFRKAVSWGEDVEVEKIIAVICEEWQLYPWIIAAGGLDFDKCRTARLIGAITFMCRVHGVSIEFQGADIKPAAVEAGAEALYLEPVHENRHANDSIQHGVFYKAVNGGPPK